MIKGILIILILLSSNTVNAEIYKKNASTEVNKKVQYAYKISGNNKKFVALLDAENSQWNEYRRSNTGYWRKGKKWYDYGICQISQYYHPQIVNDKNFYNWKWQINKCYEMYKGGTKFYGLKNIKKTILNFNFN